MLEALIPDGWAIMSLTAIGLIFGLILSISKIKLKVDKDPRIEELNDALPGANCGACGLPGCQAYATKIVEEKFDIDLCPVGGSEVSDVLADIMGLEKAGASVPVKARVHCHGGNLETSNKFEYYGPRECFAAHNLMGGYKTCEYGCLRFGDCFSACPFDAIRMNGNGLPVIDPDACVGCGKCVTACPRNIISLVPEDFEMYVMCSNKEKGPLMKKGCTVGCIACRICEKACKENFTDNPDIESAIQITDFLAVIDYNICNNCYKCVEVCPVPVINPVERSKKMQKKKEQQKEKATVEA